METIFNLEEFEQDALMALIEVRPEYSFRLAPVFPPQYSYDNKYAIDAIKAQARLASKITGFNATAPIRSYAELEQVSGKVTKIMDSYYFKESDLIEINRPRTGTNERETAINRVLLDVVELANGVDYVLEYLRARLVYDGVVEYSDPSTLVKIEFDVNRPEGNDMAAAVAWDQPDADPIADLQLALEQYRAENNEADPDRVDLSRHAEALLKRSKAVKEEVHGTGSNRIVTTALLQELFANIGLPEYFVNRDVTSIETLEENADGKMVRVRKQRKHLDDNKVVLYGAQMGNTIHGITAENGYKHGKFVSHVNEQNPPTQAVIVGEAAIPALTANSANVVLNVAGTVAAPEPEPEPEV